MSNNGKKDSTQCFVRNRFGADYNAKHSSFSPQSTCLHQNWTIYTAKESFELTNWALKSSFLSEIFFYETETIYTP